VTAVTLVLLVGNRPAPPDVAAALQELVVEATLDGASSFRLRLGTRQTPGGDWPLADTDTFSPGASVRIGASIGANPLPSFVFAGYVATQSVVYADTSGGSSVEIGGLDRTALMNLEDKTVAWPNQPDALIATQIFAQNQLIPVVDPTGPVLIDPEGTTVQRGTDIRFLRRLARRNGFEVWIAPQPNTGIEMGCFRAVSTSGSPVATLSARAGDATSVTRLRVSYDMLRPTTAKVDALDFRHSSQSADVSNESGLIGRSSALGQLSPSPVSRLTGTGLTNAADLQRAAQAAVDRASYALRAEGEVDATVGPLRPGDLVKLAGVGTAYAGSWLVRAVTHRFTPDGYTQRFVAARNAVGTDDLLGAAAGAVAGLGG
jgi:phage protein D